MVQLGVKYLPVLINLFSSFTGSDGGASGGIGGGGGAGGGLLDLVGGLIGGVTGNTKVETSAGVDPVKASTTNNVDRVDPTDLVKVQIIPICLLKICLLFSGFYDYLLMAQYVIYRTIHFLCPT